MDGCVINQVQQNVPRVGDRSYFKRESSKKAAWLSTQGIQRRVETSEIQGLKARIISDCPELTMHGIHLRHLRSSVTFPFTTQTWRNLKA